MIIVRSPLRISICGGGTDIPSYYRKNEGFLFLHQLINTYMLQLQSHFEEGIYLKYSKIEKKKIYETT